MEPEAPDNLKLPHQQPLLDVRPWADYQRHHAHWSVNIPLEELGARTHELPIKGTLLQVYDVDPDRLAQAGAWLQSRGYQVSAVRSVDVFHNSSDSMIEANQTENSRLNQPMRLWEPSAFLVQAIEHLHRVDPGFSNRPELGREQDKRKGHVQGRGRIRGGRVLDIACGSGRDAVWLAMQGYEVDGLDVLPDALERASDLAHRHGVKLYTWTQDVRKQPTLPVARYHIIIMLRFWHPPLAPAICEALLPGGYFIGEAFTPAPSEVGKRGQRPCLTIDQWPGFFPTLIPVTLSHNSPETAGNLSGWIGRKPM